MTTENKAQHTIEDLNALYNQSVETDREIFSEQRSNVMLISGHHYSGKNPKQWNRIRDMRDLPAETKLRLTKNHIQAITKKYLNQIVSASPGVQIIPRNEKEIQDQKCAQLNQSVWQFCADQMRFPIKVMSLAKDYIDIGESAVKIYWDEFAGSFIGYEQAIDETGQPMLDENEQPAPDTLRPRFSGELKIEKIQPTNLLRDSNSVSMDDSPWLGIRKMVPIKDLKKMVGDDKEKEKLITEMQREEYMVFDPSTSNYSTTKEMCLVREFYFKPGLCYPQGYFFITTKEGILFEGELPFGIYPIQYVGFDEMQSSARHRSIVKQLRPYQMEINRTASKIAEHQVTSDDKILIQSGTKISSGGVLPGVRAIQYSGQAPTILEGRAGAQYVDYMNGQIAEMYQVASVSEEEKDVQADPYGMLFRSVKQQKKFTIYIEKFEDYLRRIVTTYLGLAKQYFNEQMLVPMIGKAEYVNIPEFKSSEDMRTQIKVMPMSDDINSMFGKWLAINHAIQYVGNQLGKEDIGRLLRNVPYGNFEESFSDLTIDYDLATNAVLALERGEQVQPSPAANKLYMVKKLDKRMSESDFKMLNHAIQRNFEMLKQAYQQMDIDEKLAMQRAEQGFIPTGGPLIKTDLQVNLPNSTGGFKTTRAAFPVEALSWLQKHLEAQGSNLAENQNLPQAAQAEEARQFIPQSSQFNQMNEQTGQMQQTGPAPVQGGNYGIGKPNQF